MLREGIFIQQGVILVTNNSSRVVGKISITNPTLGQLVVNFDKGNGAGEELLGGLTSTPLGGSTK